LADRQPSLSLRLNHAKLWLGCFTLEMLNENPQLKTQLKILDLLDFTPKFEYFVDLVWSRESELGAAARFLIQHIRNQRKV
jgi:hypothetical protein